MISAIGHSEMSRTKMATIVILFVLSLVTFVVQTETTSHAYRLGFSEPLILLLLTHGLWWIIWPTQLLIVAFSKMFYLTEGGYHQFSVFDQDFNAQSRSADYTEFRQVFSNDGFNSGRFDYFCFSIKKQLHTVYHTAILVYEGYVNQDNLVDNFAALIEQHPHISHVELLNMSILGFVSSDAIRHVAKHSFYTALLLTIAGFTWYGAMALTYAADVTAIYNCLAFMAYALSIPLLHEQVLWTKTVSVLVAVAGVFVVAYADMGDANIYPNRFAGNMLILFGATLYGLYEVLYKRWLCVPHYMSIRITARRQLAFSNFIMSLFGVYTAIIVLGLAIFFHLTGIHRFNIWDYGDNTRSIWWSLWWSILSNISFSACFLALMALTSPVLSSVSSLLTIFLIGIVEWRIFGNTLSFQQILGDVLVVVGFVVLTIASWHEISYSPETDGVDAVSAYSFAAR